uniref:Uncharacterized protein n=1 Tax=Arundo donax TaxID=35708 RepID=A0A0A9GV20_ARUDO
MAACCASRKLLRAMAIAASRKAQRAVLSFERIASAGD